MKTTDAERKIATLETENAALKKENEELRNRLPKSAAPRVWDSGEDDEKTDLLINEHVWQALKEYIEAQVPQISCEGVDDWLVEFFIMPGDEQITSKKVRLDVLILEGAQWYTNDYYGTITGDGFEKLKQYLAAVVGRLDEIVRVAANIQKNQPPGEQLSPEGRKKFQELFEAINT